MNSPKVISITSGKGGVGKTNISVNLACSLASQNKNVILLDADLGLANVDVALGLTPTYNLFDLFKDISLDQVLCDTPYKFKILPASSGVHDMLSLETGQKLELLEIFDELEDNLDYLIVDTGAGIHDNVVYFNIAAQERIIILTPEPTSLTDAYALIKVLKHRHGVDSFKVIVNTATSTDMAKNVFARLVTACDHFLGDISLDLLGIIPKDPIVRKSVIKQVPFFINEPNSPAGQAIQKISTSIQNLGNQETVDGNIKFFWKKLLFNAS